jgi:nucleolar pre-ribosomal-associated protein 2
MFYFKGLEKRNSDSRSPGEYFGVFRVLTHGLFSHKPVPTIELITISQAPMAQERLLELERTGAPIIDQIQQAWLFAGIPTTETSTHYAAAKSVEAIKTWPAERFHGRQEYVLRWLMKKLQDEEMRRCTAAWKLLEGLTNYVPLKNLARILNERKFVIILRQALEEAIATLSLVDNASGTVTGIPVKAKVEGSGSKKRNRNGDILNTVRVSHSAVEIGEIIVEWKRVVHKAVDRIVQLSRPGPHSKDISPSEYLKSAIRTSVDESTRIVGAWLALCGTEKLPATTEQYNSLLPFLEIWDLRIPEPEDPKVFSKHCLNQSLKIMFTAGQQPDRVALLEKLLARTIIVPAKSAYGSSKNADYLSSLVRDAVSISPGYATILLNVTIRCIQSHGSRRRTTDDTAWLQAVIGTLKEAISLNPSEQSVIALNQMLRDCINYNIDLELPFLQLITSQYCLRSGGTNWDFLTTIIELDSNVFLIPSEPEDFLRDLLERITMASVQASWPTMADKVVDKVLTPLMGEFSKARQLTTFIYHWYDQLAEIDKLHSDIEHFTAWEDEALRLKLKELLEPSLTTLQIVEIIDWLIEKVKKCGGPACVVLDAVAGAISNDDTRATVHSTIIEKVINVLAYTGPDDRYKARLLHLNTIMADWSSCQKFRDNSVESGSSPLFLSLISSEMSFPDRDHSLVALEAFRYLCAQWSIGAPRFWNDRPLAFQNGAGIETFSNHIALVASHVRKVIEQRAEVRKLVEERWEGRVTTIKRSLGWLACAYASCILVDYPQVLEYV